MKFVFLPEKLVLFLRLSSIFCLLIFSIKITEYSIGFLILSIVSLYFVKKKPNISLKIKDIDANKLENPFLKQKETDLSEIPFQILEKTKEQLYQHFFSDFTYAESLKDFETIKNKSECIFAKKSKIWGAPCWKNELSIKENIQLIIFPSFLIFSNLCETLKIDGYSLQLPGDLFGKDIESFARAFCNILINLSELDPSGRDCMKKSNIDSSSWVFEFNKITFFITTFSPVYPETNSRYNFDAQNCYILFQPEISFAIHNLPTDTPYTNWHNPQTVRDKIRVAFRNSGREYNIRETVNYPMSHDMIRPINPQDPIVKWWIFRD